MATQNRPNGFSGLVKLVSNINEDADIDSNSTKKNHLNKSNHSINGKLNDNQSMPTDSGNLQNTTIIIFEDLIIIIVALICLTAAIGGLFYFNKAYVSSSAYDPLTTTPIVDATIPDITIKTSHGNIGLKLFYENAPITVSNFLEYVDSGYYHNTIFHRVIPDFVIQGGGFMDGMENKPVKDPIHNESDNGLSNMRGTIAMARTSNPHSATAQFYINHVDNPFLDGSPGKHGYTVFGKVIAGMAVVDSIAQVQTGNVNHFENVPDEPVFIICVFRTINSNNDPCDSKLNTDLHSSRSERIDEQLAKKPTSQKLIFLKFTIPPIGTSELLSVSDIRWCLREEIRIIVTREYSAGSIQEFNSIVSNYNKRCSQYRYHKGDLAQATTDIDHFIEEIKSDALSRVPEVLDWDSHF